MAPIPTNHNSIAVVYSPSPIPTKAPAVFQVLALSLFLAFVQASQPYSKPWFKSCLPAMFKPCLPAIFKALFKPVFQAWCKSCLPALFHAFHPNSIPSLALCPVPSHTPRPVPSHIQSPIPNRSPSLILNYCPRHIPSLQLYSKP